MKKKTLIDLSHITASNLICSISIYSIRLINSIPPGDRRWFLLLITDEMVDYFRYNYSEFDYIIWNNKKWYNLAPWVGSIITRFQYKRIVNSGKHDVILILSDAIEYTNINIPDKEKIIVVHDQKGMTSDDESYRKSSYRFYHSHILNSDKVIAISEFTKNEIIRLHDGVDVNKIHVIYNSVILPHSSSVINLPDKFILYVNTIIEYKNPFTLIKAFKNICEIDNSMFLILIGKSTDYWETTLLPYINSEHLYDKIIRLEDISNEELRYCYEKANVFVTTSTCEGFGYTPIEAAMCRCPIVCTKCQSLPEVTKGLAIYYNDPFDVDQLVRAILVALRRKDINHLTEIANVFKDAYTPMNQYTGLKSVIYS